MALITCPECGASVSSEAKVCPSCGHPINTQSKKRGRSSGFRTGAIIGLIGGIGLVGVFLLSMYLSASSQPEPPADVTVTVTTEAGNNALISGLGLILPLVVIPLFVAALIAADKIGRTAAIAMSVAALVLSATALVFMVFLLNVLSICLGWLFLWQPVLEVAGSIKMLSNAMKYEA